MNTQHSCITSVNTVLFEDVFYLREFTVNLCTAVCVNTRTNSLVSHMILKTLGG
jgi:hypothetical protein